MNTFRKLKALCVMLFITAFAYGSVYSHDAFVLVDVSGTMRDANANMEAKNIIQELLLGEFNYAKWQARGWQKVSPNDRIPSETILRQNSYFCIIPFGNKDTVKRHSRQKFQDNGSFRSFYASKFPTAFHDSWTYLTLAKAYVGSLAVLDKISSGYVIIYTDGRPESTRQPYDDFEQSIVDSLEYAGSNSFQKIAILRKNGTGAFHYDVEMWEFKSYKTTPTDDPPIIDETSSVTTRSTIKIIAPQDGKNKNRPHEVRRDEEWKLQWTGGAGNIIVSKKDGNSYKRIAPGKSREIYSVSKSGLNAKLTFFESADYKVEVRGTKGGVDAIYVSVTTPFVPILLRLLLIAGIIVACVFAYNKYFGPGSKPHKDPYDDKRKKQPSSRPDKDDW